MHHRVREGPVLTGRSEDQTAALVSFTPLPPPPVFNICSFFPCPDFLGRTKVPVATIKKEIEVKGAASRHFLLHEVATGEVCVKLDLQLYDK